DGRVRPGDRARGPNGKRRTASNDENPGLSSSSGATPGISPHNSERNWFVTAAESYSNLKTAAFTKGTFTHELFAHFAKHKAHSMFIVSCALFIQSLYRRPALPS